jgi:hypothetical protein
MRSGALSRWWVTQVVENLPWYDIRSTTSRNEDWSKEAAYISTVYTLVQAICSIVWWRRWSKIRLVGWILGGKRGKRRRIVMNKSADVCFSLWRGMGRALCSALITLTSCHQAISLSSKTYRINVPMPRFSSPVALQSIKHYRRYWLEAWTTPNKTAGNCSKKLTQRRSKVSKRRHSCSYYPTQNYFRRRKDDRSASTLETTISSSFLNTTLKP